MQQAVDAAQVDKRAVVGEVLHRAGEHRALAQLLQGGRALGVLLFFQDFLAADDHVAALLVQLDDADFDLLAEIAVQIAHRANLKLRAGQKRLQADIDGEAALDAADHRAHHRRLVVGGLLDHVPHAQALGLLVADQVAAFRLLALDHHVDHVAGLELDRAGVIDHLLQRHQALGLQAHIHHQVLVGLLDHRAGDDLVAVGLDGGSLSGLLALERCQSGRKIVHGFKSMFGVRGLLRRFDSRRSFCCGRGLGLRCGSGWRPGLRARERWRRIAWARPRLSHGRGLGYRLGWGIGVQRELFDGASAVSGLDVDSDDGCSSSVAGSRVGISNSVFRVMLSGSGLRTFAITAAPGFLAPAANEHVAGGGSSSAIAVGDAGDRHSTPHSV